MSRQRAACASMDPEMFFPLGPGPGSADVVERAKVVCYFCPIREACLDDALEMGAEFGIWGGFTPEERRSMGAPARRLRRKNADPRDRTELVRRMADLA